MLSLLEGRERIFTEQKLDVNISEMSRCALQLRITRTCIIHISVSVCTAGWKILAKRFFHSVLVNLKLRNEAMYIDEDLQLNLYINRKRGRQSARKREMKKMEILMLVRISMWKLNYVHGYV